VEGVFGVSTDSFAYQIGFLLLRLDFLDLMAVLRQITLEMRLVGCLPQKYTRTYLHLRSTVRGFESVACRYNELCQRHGLSFQDGVTPTYLRVLGQLSHFMANSVGRLFAESLPHKSNKLSADALAWSTLPIAELIRKLVMALEAMDSSVNPILRAAAMLEVIDAICMTPIPYSKDFFAPKPCLLASLLLSPAVEDSIEFAADAIESSPSLGFTFVVSGSIPEALLIRSKQPCCILILSYRIAYVCQLDEDEVPAMDDEQTPETGREAIEGRVKILSSYPPVSSPVFRGGKFFFSVDHPPIFDEGIFDLAVKICCKDVSGQVWDVPLFDKSRHIPVRISRGR
jgi:hypothetical protein